MVNENIEVFMEKINFISKDISKYRDEENGNCMTIGTSQLFPRLETMELTSQELKKAKFENIIDDIKYEQVEFERPVPKSEITKREEDKYTITMKKIKGYKVFNVYNALKIKKSFSNFDEAIKCYDKIDNMVNKVYE